MKNLMIVLIAFISIGFLKAEKGSTFEATDDFSWTYYHKFLGKYADGINGLELDAFVSCFTYPLFQPLFNDINDPDLGKYFVQEFGSSLCNGNNWDIYFQQWTIDQSSGEYFYNGTGPSSEDVYVYLGGGCHVEISLEWRYQNSGGSFVYVTGVGERDQICK